MATEVADLVAKLRLDAGEFAKGFKEADKGLLGLIAGGTALGEVFVQLGAMALDAMKAVVSFPLEAAKAAGVAAEQFSQLSQRTGIAVQSLQGLQVAMAREGMETAALAQGFRTLSGHMVGLSNSTKESVDLFNQLGISAETVAQGTGATLAAIADKFAGMADGAEKSRFAIELFGRAGLQLIPILNQGAAGLDAAMQKAAEFGLILTKTQQDDLTTFDDAMDDLGSAMKGFTAQVGAAFAPSLTALINMMTQAVVFAKDTFNLFADAGAKLTIRLGAMAAALSVMAQQLFSFSIFSKEAWKQTLDQVQAIDGWAAAQLKAVDATRAQSSSLDQVAKAQLTAGGAAKEHAVTQEQLGRQIVQATQAMQSQQKQLGELQSQKGRQIVQQTGAELAIVAQLQAEEGAQQRRLALAAIVDAQMQVREREAEGRRQEALGRQIVQQAQASQSIAQSEVDRLQAEEDAVRDRFTEEVNAAMQADAQLEAFRANKIVAESTAAQQVKGFWEQQLGALVQSNAFSVSQITTAWTSGVANSIVRGGDFVKQAWESTQIAIIQGGLNLAIQWGAQQAQMAMASAASAGVTTGVWAGAATAITGYFATVTTAFKLMMANLVTTMVAVGEFIMGVLAAIAEALTATVFGIPYAGAILVGIALIAAALAAAGVIEFAEGGIVTRPTMGLVGEAGPEAIIPLSKLGAMGGHSGPVTIVLELDGRTLMRYVANQLPSTLRLKGLPA